MTSIPAAFLFDLNGTMIDDMAFHMDAWSDILNNDLRAGLTREEVKLQMYGKNSELFIRVFGAGRFTQEEMDKISMEKERRYQAKYKPHLHLIAGLDEFLKRANNNGIKMAIGSAAIPFNINFVLDNLDLHHYFGAVVSAEDVVVSKPHPETYLKAADLLGVPHEACVVFEDAPKGVEAAARAGMKCVVLTTLHEADEFENTDHVLMFVKDYTDPRLTSLFAS